MSQVVNASEVESKIFELRGEQVILDSDVAELYGVETKHVNQAVKNNPEKFLENYIVELSKEEWGGLKSKNLTSSGRLESVPVKSKFLTSPEKWAPVMVKSQFATSPLGGGKVKLPKAFTEKGLYMLATILKSQRATETTLSIIETFSKVREIARAVKQLPVVQENTPAHQALVQKVGDLVSDLLVPEELSTSESEASIELNFVVAKLKYSVKKNRRKQ